MSIKSTEILSKEEILRLANKRANEIDSFIEQHMPQYEKLTSHDAFNALRIEFGYDALSKDDYEQTGLSTIDPKVVKEYFQAAKEAITKYLAPVPKISANWDKYNPNYKKQISLVLGNWDVIIPPTFHICNILKKPNEFVTLYKAFAPPYEIYFNRYLILEHFAYTDNNYVIFGKNGAGKTKLLKQLPSALGDENSYLIPSDRDIGWGIKKPRLDFKVKEKELGSTFKLDEMGWSANRFLTMLLTSKAGDEEKAGQVTYSNDMHRLTSVTLAKTVEIFNALSPSRKIRYTFEKQDERWVLYNDDVTEYSISEASDGERSLLQYIIYILLCPQNSFVFIDEPENHLNTALLCNLFDFFERERKDIIFIYCTHCIDFIESRENAKLLYLKGFTGKGWDIKPVDDFDNIPISVIASIIGTKKELLFIEGANTSLDNKLYSRLFQQFRIMPVGSCEKVKELCKSVNGHHTMFQRKAYGIIDNDFRRPHEIERLKANGIFVLAFSEIENFLICEEFVEQMCAIKNDGDLSRATEFKKKILEMMGHDKSKIMTDYINKAHLINIRENPAFEYRSPLKLRREIMRLNRKSTRKLMNEILKFRKELDSIISEANYTKVVRQLPNKRVIDCVTILGFKNSKEYIDELLSYLDSNEDFAHQIVEIYFSDLNCG